MIDFTSLLGSIISLLPSIAIFSLMFSMGMGLVADDFLYVFRKPKAAVNVYRRIFTEFLVSEIRG